MKPHCFVILVPLLRTLYHHNHDKIPLINFENVKSMNLWFQNLLRVISWPSAYRFWRLCEWLSWWSYCRRVAPCKFCCSSLATQTGYCTCTWTYSDTRPPMGRTSRCRSEWLLPRPWGSHRRWASSGRPCPLGCSNRPRWSLFVVGRLLMAKPLLLVWIYYYYLQIILRL